MASSIWYTSSVSIEQTENGFDNESGLYDTSLSDDYLDINSFGSIVSLETMDNALNQSNIYATVKIDMDEPIIYGIDDDLIVKVGESADFDKGVMVLDAISGGLGYTLSMSNTKDLAIGEYEVTYTAYDEAGNSAEYIRNLVVVSEEDYEDYFEEVCIGDDCVCSAGDCECYGDDCDQSVSKNNLNRPVSSKYQVTLEPATSKSMLSKQNNWINKAFYLNIKTKTTDNSKIGYIYWCISTSDNFDAESCNPFDYFDGSKKSPYKNGYKTISKQIRVTLSKNPKVTKATSNGSEKICAYAVGMDGTRSDVVCSSLYKIDIEKPSKPSLSIVGPKVIRTTSAGKKVEYYASGASASLASFPTDNLTTASDLKLTITPKNAQSNFLNGSYKVLNSQTIGVKVTDLAGNYVSISQRINIDKTKPPTPSRKSYKLYSNKRIYNGNKSNEPIKIVLSNSSSNVGARIDHYEVSTDKVNWQQISSGFVIYESGRYYFRSVDEFGQASSETSFVANITIPSTSSVIPSITSPQITIKPSGYSSSKEITVSYVGKYSKYLKVNGSENVVTNSNLIRCSADSNLNLTCTGDIPSGTKLVEGVWYMIPDSTASLTAYDNYTTISARVVNSDNYARTVSKQISTIDTVPTAPTIKGGSNNWQNKARIILDKASATASGKVTYEYCASDVDSSNSCNWIKLDTSELIYSTNGNHYIFFRAESPSGLKSEASNSVFVKIDSEGPKANIVDGSDIAYINLIDEESGLNKYCIADRDNIDICMTSKNNNDDKVNVNTWYTINNTSKSLSFTFSSGGTYYVFVYDNAGNTTKQSFKIVYSGITDRGYKVGEELNYAGLSWKVMSDNGSDVTLILNGYYKSGAYGDNTAWSTSNAKSIVNEDFVNTYEQLKHEVEQGGILYDSTSSSYVRLPRREEISSAVAMTAQYPFWTMTPTSSSMYVSSYNGETYRDVANVTNEIAAYQGYTYTSSDNYNEGDEEFYLKNRFVYNCSGTKKEEMTASPTVTSIIVGSTCGSRSTEYYSTTATNSSTSATGKPSFYYCDEDSGRTKVSESSTGYSTKWTYANGSTSNCTSYTVYHLQNTSKAIVYRPVITVKKRTDRTEVPILENKTYTFGNVVEYASLNWKVISDNSNTVTLILDGNYKTGSFGSTVAWASSKAKDVVNNQFLNDNILLNNAINSGYIEYNNTSQSYVRLPFESEISTAIPSSSGLPFWTMTSKDDEMVFSTYDGKLTRDYYKSSKSSYYSGYDWYYRDSYDATTAKAGLQKSYITSCSNATVDNLASPSWTSLNISGKCGSSKSLHYNTTSTPTSTSRAASSSIYFTYCDESYGPLSYAEKGGSGSSETWIHSSGSSTNCTKTSEYQPEIITSAIGYRPVITVVKGKI